MKNRIAWLTVCLLIIGSMLLSACGSQASSNSEQYLTINFEQVSTWVRNFNPFSANALGSTATAIYEPMMIYNKATGKLVPWLATDYTWSTDNTLLTFKIRQNVKWSDGQPFTAQDVLYTFNLIKSNSALTGTASSIMQEYIDSITAPDDFTIEFKFNTVYTPALYDIADQVIVPQHIWKDVSDPLTWTNDNPVATGPFTQVTKFDSQIYILEKNPYYWQTGKPTFKGIRYPAFADNDAANLALANGDLDWAGNFVPDIEKTYVAKDPTNFHYYFVGGDGVSLMINTTLKPFDNPDVRKAISLGIDRAMIVQTAEYNYIPAADATGLGATYTAWKDPAVVASGTWVKYDVTKANQMLDAAGLKRGSDGIRLDQDGKPMKYQLIVPSGWTDWISAAQIICQNMSDLGITLELQTPEETTWTDTVTKGQFQWSIVYGTGGPSPYNYYRGEMSKLTVEPVGQNSTENWGRYDSPVVDQLLAQFAQTSDIDQQKQIMSKIEAAFVNEAPELPLFPGPDWYEYNTSRFTGFPSADNPYAPGIPYAYAPYNATLIILTTITPK
ncbi:MAG: ABC transporter substrate-binding protein [Anaerolineaceae bacterium]|jgi:peptide/nickel transport system substrate-binding protein